MKISIVTAYYNRKKYFINTLESINKSSYNNFEVIAVDDASNEENRIEDLSDKYPFLRVIRIDPKDKKHTNPCVPFNIGFNNATGEVVILQNPECFHTEDIISYVAKNLKENDYFVFGCFSLDKEKTEIFCKNINTNIEKFIVNKSVDGTSSDGWYNHSVYRPVGYHFTSAIYKKNLDLLGGFDEKFAFGIGYDDDEFLHRVKKVCNFKILDKPLVLHQYHYNYDGFDSNLHNNLVKINRDLFHKIITTN